MKILDPHCFSSTKIKLVASVVAKKNASKDYETILVFFMNREVRSPLSKMLDHQVATYAI